MSIKYHKPPSYWYPGLTEAGRYILDLEILKTGLQEEEQRERAARRKARRRGPMR